MIKHHPSTITMYLFIKKNVVLPSINFCVYLLPTKGKDLLSYNQEIP